MNYFPLYQNKFPKNLKTSAMWLGGKILENKNHLIINLPKFLKISSNEDVPNQIYKIDIKITLVHFFFIFY